MFAPLAAAAPHVGSALVAGAKATAGFAIAAKATQFGRRNAEDLLDRIDDARTARRQAKIELAVVKEAKAS
jgi:hypothetical protein